MTDQHKIAHVNDTLQFTEDQFGRFLVDFAAWWAFCKMAQGQGAEVVGFTWVDDKMSGEIHSVDAIDPKTGETWQWQGPAYSPTTSDGNQK